jgi:hypothetical protein
MMSALVGLSERGYGMTLLLSLVAANCAVIVAVVFVMAWRDEDVLVTAMLGVVLLSLLLVAMVALRESI